MKAIAADSPRLAPPGAGLPKLELWIARWRFGRARRRATRERAAATLERERAAILARVEGCDDAAGSRPVLIARLRGMEDSSRRWSVFMTLEHLRIVNAAVARTIRLLGRGERPPQPASTAAVKPAVGVGPETRAAFADSCAAVAEAVAHLPAWHTEATFAHPWFGELDAAGWHVMAGFHLALHRRQIEGILAALGTGACPSPA